MLLSVSVDLDETHHYRAIHGLRGRGLGSEVYSRALPRLAEFARQRNLPITWFVVGRDLALRENVEALSALVARGDEIGCHSLSHLYDLTRRSYAQMRNEVEGGVRTIEQALSTKVHGFRAPGYTINDTLLDVIRESGLAYDSSVFPCPPYHALKAAALLAARARGRESVAIQTPPEVLRAPTQPYRVGRPFWYRGSGVLEVPIQVTRRARLPFIGTSLTLAGTFGARVLAQGVVGEPFVNLELHGLDALDINDGLEDLAKPQRDLRIPWSKKLAAIDAAISLLRQKQYQPVRLDELARRALSEL